MNIMQEVRLYFMFLCNLVFRSPWLPLFFLFFSAGKSFAGSERQRTTFKISKFKTFKGKDCCIKIACNCKLILLSECFLVLTFCNNMRYCICKPLTEKSTLGQLLFSIQLFSRLKILLKFFILHWENVLLEDSWMTPCVVYLAECSFGG